MTELCVFVGGVGNVVVIYRVDCFEWQTLMDMVFTFLTWVRVRVRVPCSILTDTLPLSFISHFVNAIQHSYIACSYLKATCRSLHCVDSLLGTPSLLVYH